MKKFCTLFLKYLCIALISLGVSELICAVAHFEPIGRYSAKNATPFASDSILGWIHKPGTYLQQRKDGRRGEMHIHGDGTRASTASPLPGEKKELAIFGCSFTEGSGFLTDAETYPAYLQPQFPDLEIKNRGVTGYGTVQSLLAMQQLLKERDNKQIAAILYGFVDFHDLRNALHPDWLRGLQTSTTFEVKIPFAYLDPQGQPVITAPRGYPLAPFARWSRVATLLGEFILWSEQHEIVEHRAELTVALVKQMQEVSRAKGVPFAVVVLDSYNTPREQYVAAFQHAGITTIDCTPSGKTREIIPDDKHPDGALNQKWATCIASQLREKLPELQRESSAE